MINRNALAVYSSIQRGFENSKFAVRAMFAAHRRGEIDFNQREAMESAARGLDVQRRTALDAWNAGAYL